MSAGRSEGQQVVWLQDRRDQTRPLTLEASSHGVKVDLGAQEVVVDVGEAGVGQVVPPVELQRQSFPSKRE
jgi:hypothetical protein